MTTIVTLRTERLVLRPWRESDRGPFAAINADPRVMEHFPRVKTREESDAGFDGIVARMERQGYGLWAAEHWGRGYATEGGRASLAHAFEALGQAEVVSFAPAGNERSRRVMEKLGMRRRPEDDFDHPGVPATWPGRRHVLYRISRARWRGAPA